MTKIVIDLNDNNNIENPWEHYKTLIAEINKTVNDKAKIGYDLKVTEPGICNICLEIPTANDICHDCMKGFKVLL